MNAGTAAAAAAWGASTFANVLQLLGACYNARTAPRLEDHEAAGRAGPYPRVSLLIPARDEEANLEALMPMLARLEWPDLEILILDDESRDATARIAGSGRARVLAGEELELDVAFEERIEDRIRNLVADLVRVTFRNRLAGEQVVLVRHCRHSLRKRANPRQRILTMNPGCSCSAPAQGQDAGRRGRNPRRASRDPVSAPVAMGRRKRTDSLLLAGLIVAGHFLDQIDDAPPQLGILDPDESARQRKTVRGGEEVGDVGG